ncbi:MAG: hypothetical protein HC924_18105 [Synechococcaceae cyanobacterium SM2_3_2]|nr:hypothetical protein [Synechococcaceae cyanobacterium SM2_3_2]
MLAIAAYLPHIRFHFYNRRLRHQIPDWIHNVKQVTTLEPGKGILCEHGWESAHPYQPHDFTHSLCIRKISRQNPDMAGYDTILTVSDINRTGDFPPVVLETPALPQPCASHIIASSEKKNRQFLAALYPHYAQEIVFPLTAYRLHLNHVVGIAGYNLFWECAYYRIPCQLYRSQWFNDSHWRLDQLGEHPIPSLSQNGAPLVAEALWQYLQTCL